MGRPLRGIRTCPTTQPDEANNNAAGVSTGKRITHVPERFQLNPDDTDLRFSLTHQRTDAPAAVSDLGPPALAGIDFQEASVPHSSIDRIANNGQTE